MVEVQFYGALRYVEVPRHILVRQTLSDEVHDATLPHCERLNERGCPSYFDGDA
jgi:hypothetical protein